jgi:hypothetical protein
MSPIALGLDLLLAVLLGAALVVGLRLNSRLKLLRQSQTEFGDSVAALNAAAARAETGLAELRAASEEVHDSLLARIETARGLIDRLDGAIAEAGRSPATAAKTTTASGHSLAAIAAMAQPVAAEVFRRPPPSAVARPPGAGAGIPPTTRNRSAFDEELFDRPARRRSDP